MRASARARFFQSTPKRSTPCRVAGDVAQYFVQIKKRDLVLVERDDGDAVFYYVEKEYYWLSSASERIVKHVNLAVREARGVTKLATSAASLRSRLSLEAAVEKVKKKDDFMTQQIIRAVGKTSFKGGQAWDWEKRRIIQVSKKTAGLVRPIDREIPRDLLDNLENFSLPDDNILMRFLKSIMPIDDERDALLSDLALAAAGRSDKLAAIILLIGPPNAGKSLLLNLVRAAIGPYAKVFQLAELTAAHTKLKDSGAWKVSLQGAAMGVCSDTKEKDATTGNVIFDGAALTYMFDRNLDAVDTVTVSWCDLHFCSSFLDDFHLVQVGRKRMDVVQTASLLAPLNQTPYVHPATMDTKVRFRVYLFRVASLGGLTEASAKEMYVKDPHRPIELEEIKWIQDDPDLKKQLSKPKVVDQFFALLAKNYPVDGKKVALPEKLENYLMHKIVRPMIARIATRHMSGGRQSLQP